MAAERAARYVNTMWTQIDQVFRRILTWTKRTKRKKDFVGLSFSHEFADLFPEKAQRVSKRVSQRNAGKSTLCEHSE